MRHFEEKQKFRDDLFIELKKKFRNIDPDFIVKRYLDHDKKSYCDLYKIFSGVENSFEVKEPVEKLFYDAYEAKPSYGLDDLEEYKIKIVDFFNRLIKFVEALPETEIKKMGSAYRASKRRNKERYSAEQRPYTGACHRDREITQLSLKLNKTKRAAAEQAVDLAYEVLCHTNAVAKAEAKGLSINEYITQLIRESQ